MGVFLRSFVKQLPQFINMVQFTGNFVRTKEEKYEDFLTKLGVGYLMRKAATSPHLPWKSRKVAENGRWRQKLLPKASFWNLNWEKSLMKQLLMVANVKPL